MLDVIKGVPPPRAAKPVASWPAELSADDIAWCEAQWVLAGGSPTPEPLSLDERHALARYMVWDSDWATTELVR